MQRKGNNSMNETIQPAGQWNSSLEEPLEKNEKFLITEGVNIG